MYRLLASSVIVSFLCLDRNWQLLDDFHVFTSKMNFLVDSINTQFDACDQYTSHLVKEDFTGGSYRYEVSLPEYSGNFNVTIKYRSMLILGHERQFKQCDLTYYTVTTLPEYVDTSRAVWSFEFGTLTVLIPGKKDLTEGVEFARYGCYYYFSTNEIIVPRITFTSTE